MLFFLYFPPVVSRVSIGGGARAARLPAHLHQPPEPDVDGQPPAPQQYSRAHPQRHGLSSHLLHHRVWTQALPHIKTAPPRTPPWTLWSYNRQISYKRRNICFFISFFFPFSVPDWTSEMTKNRNSWAYLKISALKLHWFFVFDDVQFVTGPLVFFFLPFCSLCVILSKHCLFYFFKYHYALPQYHFY